MFGIYIERAGDEWWAWSLTTAAGAPLQARCSRYILRRTWPAL
jgi:hypothetical protein